MRKASKIWYAVLAITLLLLLGGGLSAWFHRLSRESVFPLENGVAWFRRQFVNRLVPVFQAQATLNRLQDLEDENARLKINARLLELVAVENAQLRQQADLPPRIANRLERCLVLSRGGTSGWWRSLRLDKGSNAGIRVGDAVLSPDGLVGLVCEVSASTADVRLITDPSSRIACALEMGPGMPPARGILQGAGWTSRNEEVSRFLYVVEPMRLDYLNRDLPGDLGAKPPARTRVVTSGLGGAIPEGLPVGWLIDTEIEPNGLYRTGSVLPAVDFANLKTLFVMIGTGRAP